MWTQINMLFFLSLHKVELDIDTLILNTFKLNAKKKAQPKMDPELINEVILLTCEETKYSQSRFPNGMV